VDFPFSHLVSDNFPKAHSISSLSIQPRRDCRQRGHDGHGTARPDDARCIGRRR